jgi:hypothetical protein
MQNLLGRFVSVLLLALVALVGPATPAQAATDFDHTRWGAGDHHRLSMGVNWERLPGGGIRVNSIFEECEGPRDYQSPAIIGVRVKLTAGNGDTLWERTGDAANVPSDCTKLWTPFESFPNRNRIEVFYSGIPNHTLEHDHCCATRQNLVVLNN